MIIVAKYIGEPRLLNGFKTGETYKLETHNGPPYWIHISDIDSFKQRSYSNLVDFLSEWADIKLEKDDNKFFTWSD